MQKKRDETGVRADRHARSEGCPAKTHAQTLSTSQCIYMSSSLLAYVSVWIRLLMPVQLK